MGGGIVLDWGGGDGQGFGGDGVEAGPLWFCGEC